MGEIIPDREMALKKGVLSFSSFSKANKLWHLSSLRGRYYLLGTVSFIWYSSSEGGYHAYEILIAACALIYCMSLDFSLQ